VTAVIGFEERPAPELTEFVVYLSSTEGDDSYWSRHRQSLFVCAVANRKRGWTGAERTNKLFHFLHTVLPTKKWRRGGQPPLQPTSHPTRRERRTADALAAQLKTVSWASLASSLHSSRNSSPPPQAATVAGVRAQVAVGGVGQPGRMAPVMIRGCTARDYVFIRERSQGSVKKIRQSAERRHYRHVYDAPWRDACACLRTSSPWSIICATYGMWNLSMEQKYHLFISSAFSKELRKLWQEAYQAAPASTTGIGQGSKACVAFLNLFAALAPVRQPRWQTNSRRHETF